MDLKFVTLETFVIQFIVLLVVIWVLNKFLFKPYLAYLDEWNNKKQKIEKDYKNIDKLVSDAEKEKEEVLKDARKKGKEIVTEAESIGKQKKEAIISKAEDEAQDLLKTTKQEIEKEREFMINSIKSNVINFVLNLNQKMFKKENINKEFIEKELEAQKM